MFQKQKYYYDYPEYPDFTCEVCGQDMVMIEQPGQWICDSGEQHYQEKNNVTNCLSPNCPNQILSDSGSFTKPILLSL